MSWHQRELTLERRRRGFHPITEEIAAAMPELASVRTGLLHVFIMHTSASLTINENADSDVLRDMEASLNELRPKTSRTATRSRALTTCRHTSRRRSWDRRSRFRSATADSSSEPGRGSISASTATTPADAG